MVKREHYFGHYFFELYESTITSPMMFIKNLLL